MSTATTSKPATPSIPPGLFETDQLLRRWARGERIGGGGLHPLEAIRLLHDGAILGGSDAPIPAEITIVDEIVRTSPADTKAFVEVWYRGSAPVYLKAQRLGIARTTIYEKHKQHLNYIRGRLHGRGVQV